MRKKEHRTLYQPPTTRSAGFLGHVAGRACFYIGCYIVGFVVTVLVLQMLGYGS